MFATPGWDLALFTWINQAARHPVLDWLMVVASEAWILWAAGAAVFAVLLRKGGRKAAAPLLFVVLAAGAADGVAHLAKEGIGRVRPLNDLAGTHFREDGRWQRRPADFVGQKERGNSYISAHAANSMAVAAAAMLVWPVTRSWLWLLPLVTAYSRIYLGKHYPVDVLAGWLAGLAVALALWGLWRAAIHLRRAPRSGPAATRR